MIRFLSSIAFVYLNAISVMGMNSFAPEDLLQVKTVVDQFTNSWNDNKCIGLGALYHDDGVFINIAAMKFVGPEEIELRHRLILNDFLKDSEFAIADLSIQPLTADVAIATVDWVLNNYREPGDNIDLPGTMRNGVFTHVFMKRDNFWKIVRSQNTLHPTHR